MLVPAQHWIRSLLLRTPSSEEHEQGGLLVAYNLYADHTLQCFYDGIAILQSFATHSAQNRTSDYSATLYYRTRLTLLIGGIENSEARTVERRVVGKQRPAVDLAQTGLYNPLD